MFQEWNMFIKFIKTKVFQKQLRTFFISQPSLSANVKRVEKKVGFPIFGPPTAAQSRFL